MLTSMSSFKTIYFTCLLDSSQNRNNRKEVWDHEWILLIAIFQKLDLSLQALRQTIQWTLIHEHQMKSLKKKIGLAQLVIMIKEKSFVSFRNLSSGMKKTWGIMLILLSTVSNSLEILFHSDFMMWRFLKLSLNLFPQKEEQI